MADNYLTITSFNDDVHGNVNLITIKFGLHQSAGVTLLYFRKSLVATEVSEDWGHTIHLISYALVCLFVILSFVFFISDL